jgi:hypothetical protein
MVLVVILSSAGTGWATPDLCFEEPMKLAKKDPDAALVAFRRATKKPECDDPLVLYNVAQLTQRIAERDGERRRACEAVTAYDRFLAKGGMPELEPDAKTGRATMEAECKRDADRVAAAPVRATPRMSLGDRVERVLPQIVIGVGLATAVVGGALVGVAQAEYDQARVAHSDYRQSTTRAEFKSRGDAVESRLDSAGTYQIVGTILLGVGLGAAGYGSSLYVDSLGPAAGRGNPVFGFGGSF